MKAIELKNITFAYSGYDTKVLDGVNFYLEYGKLTLLAGTSGNGKSTLFSIINGIIPNSIQGNLSGDVFLDEIAITDMKTGERAKKIGSVLQNADSQIIQPIVEDEIAFGCENFSVQKDVIEKRIDQGCEMFSLDKFAKTRTLSGGQKQRLITVSTLATLQKIVLLDEPLANLDSVGADELMSSLSNLAKSGYAVLIIEHRLDKVLPYADEVWNMSNGKTEKIEDKTAFLLEQLQVIKDESIMNIQNKTLFSIEDIRFAVKKQEILKDVNFEIKKGERVVILGENGCGKTTLTKIIARLIKQSGGKIEQSISKKFGNKKKGNADWFKKVGYIYQNPNYQLFMPTVEQELLFAGYSLEYCQKIVDLFGIEPLLERHPQSLSEGQKRKVTIAVMLAVKPEVLILDEPTVGQDYDGLKNIVKILNQIHDEENNTMISVTHDKRCAESMCDKAVWIENGQVKEVGGKELIQKYFKY